MAATTPSAVAIPVTSIDASSGGVRIQWTQPSANGATITRYYIEI